MLPLYLSLPKPEEKMVTINGKHHIQSKVTYSARITKNEPEAKQKTNSQHEVVRLRFSCFLAIVEIGR